MPLPLVLLRHITGVPTWQDYLKKLPQFKLGFDPNLISIADYNTLSTTTTLVPIPSNLIDEIWPDQPARSSNPVSIHPVKYAGKSAQDKLQQVRTEMEKLGAQALVVSLLDEVACTFRSFLVSFLPTVDRPPPCSLLNSLVLAISLSSLRIPRYDRLD